MDNHKDRQVDRPQSLVETERKCHKDHRDHRVPGDRHRFPGSRGDSKRRDLNLFVAASGKKAKQLPKEPKKTQVSSEKNMVCFMNS